VIPAGLFKVCEWCGCPLNEKQVVACSTSHRLKRHRWLHGIRDAQGRLERPPEGSVLLMGSAAVRAGECRSNGSRAGSPQANARAMVEVLVHDLNVPVSEARRLVGKAVPVRQRERWLA
jgi:hypothetical protein